MRPPPLRDPGTTSDLVAFEVEGSGYYLVPLAVLAEYEIEAEATGETVAPVGWGWALPIVRWNTFHSSQVGTRIALAPGVLTALAERHFTPPTTEGHPA
jgi:hypothetical protein